MRGLDKRGILLIGVMLLVVLMGIGTLIATPYFNTVMRREQEEELQQRLQSVRQGMEVIDSRTVSQILNDPAYGVPITDQDSLSAKKDKIEKHLKRLIKQGYIREFASEPNLDGLTFNVTENLLKKQDPSFEVEIKKKTFQAAIGVAKDFSTKDKWTYERYAKEFIKPLRRVRCPYCGRMNESQDENLDGTISTDEYLFPWNAKYQQVELKSTTCQYDDCGMTIAYPYFKLIPKGEPCQNPACTAGVVIFDIDADTGLLKVGGQAGVFNAICPIASCGVTVEYLIDKGDDMIGSNVAVYTEEERHDHLTSDIGPATPDNKRYADYEGQEKRFGRQCLSIWNPPK